MTEASIEKQRDSDSFVQKLRAIEEWEIDSVVALALATAGWQHFPHAKLASRCGHGTDAPTIANM
jgi:hypothetical protein